MLTMQNKISKPVRRHRWDVSTTRARAIQDELRKHWIGEDRFGKIGTVAGLDAAFVLFESQAIRKRVPLNRWNAQRAANRAIGCVVMYQYPELEEIDRAYAILPLQFPYVPGLLSFREIPVLLAALAKLKSLPDLLFCDSQGYAHPHRMGLGHSLGNRAGPSHNRLRKKPLNRHLRTKNVVTPIFVSQGHRVSLP